jgi:hypothetical protein
LVLLDVPTRPPLSTLALSSPPDLSIGTARPANQEERGYKGICASRHPNRDHGEFAVNVDRLVRFAFDDDARVHFRPASRLSRRSFPVTAAIRDRVASSFNALT